MKNIILNILVLSLLCSCSTGMHHAIKYNDLKAVRQLVDEGKVNNRIGMHDYTPLIMAAYYGYVDIAEYLCKNGADIDARDGNGQTALFHSAYNGFYDVARVLVQYGAATNLKDKDGHSALYYAKLNRFYRIVDLLERNGAV